VSTSYDKNNFGGYHKSEYKAIGPSVALHIESTTHGESLPFANKTQLFQDFAPELLILLNSFVYFIPTQEAST
jgi:hypothetical protein